MNSADCAGARSGGREEPPLRDFRLDGWIVEPSRNRLVRGATAIRIRPQLIDVLACLAAHPGQVVSKARLLSEVWNDRYVAESGVARCMAELRQLLADDARKPRVIETIPKRGYRLIVHVEPLEAEPGLVTATDPAPVATPDVPAAQAVSMPDPVPWHARLVCAARGFLAAAATLAEVARHLSRRVGG